MRIVSLTEAKRRLCELVRLAEGGKETLIARRGKPVVRLAPLARPEKAFRSRAAFRAELPKARTSSVELIRRMRDEAY